MRCAIAFVVFCLAFASAGLAQPRAAAVDVQAVEMRELAETVPVFAEVTTARDGIVASRVAGTVERVPVLVGMRVAEGDVLAELDASLLRIQVVQAEAQLTEAEAGIATADVRLDRARTTFTRIDQLRSSNTFSQGRFDEADADVREARAQLVEAQARMKTAEARLAEARYQLARSVIVAPFSGVVTEVSVIPGAFLAAGAPVVRLLDTNAFEVQASVPARYVPYLEPGQRVQARTELDAPLELKLRAILPLEEGATRTRAVRFGAMNPADLSNGAAGQSLTVEIPVGAARDLLSVPKDALVQAQGGWIVFLAVDGKAQPRPVTLGLPIADRYEVVSGLAEGDLVVVRGNERLRPGQDIAFGTPDTN